MRCDAVFLVNFAFHFAGTLRTFLAYPGVQTSLTVTSNVSPGSQLRVGNDWRGLLGEDDLCEKQQKSEGFVECTSASLLGLANASGKKQFDGFSADFRGFVAPQNFASIAPSLYALKTVRFLQILLVALLFCVPTLRAQELRRPQD